MGFHKFSIGFRMFFYRFSLFFYRCFYDFYKFLIVLHRFSIGFHRIWQKEFSGEGRGQVVAARDFVECLAEKRNSGGRLSLLVFLLQVSSSKQ